MLRRRAVLGLVSVGAAASLLAGPIGEAGAHRMTFKSIVEIDGYETAGAFIGGVGSFDNKRCKSFRVVTVWKRNPGAMDGPFGTTRTNKFGNWRLEVTAPPGNYYATVKKKLLRRKLGHRHVCSFDRSSNFVIGG